ncbi:Uroporphyrinogen III synthase HEM4 [mine drainage metagenome]|uniref:uroporphyrinogen-III synthase n=2 Tax=mine drainage metagenome TaxID=410659 RepID=T1AG13_9ZZZZ
MSKASEISLRRRPEPKPLAGLGVLLTRPEGQNEALAQRIEALGGRAYAYPIFTIRPLLWQGKPLTLTHPNHYDWLIFVSPNAAEHGFRALGQRWPRRCKLAAVGEGTARRLYELGARQVYVPNSGFGSEALVESTDFKSVRGLRCLVLRGRGGRDWLAAQLSNRGAEVDTLEIYERVRSAAAPVLEEKLFEGVLDVVTVTSAQTLLALIEGLSEEGAVRLRHLLLLTAGSRVLELARVLGFVRSPLVATGPGDESLLRTLLEWWTGPEEEV